MTSDPSHAPWQHALAVAFNKVGQVFQLMGDEASAQASFATAVEMMLRAIVISPTNAGWERDLKNLKSWLATK